MNAVQQLLTDHIDIWTAAETEKKTGRGRASGNVASVYGITKLRELILELGVRGKLVPQDKCDEPASELLKRIQAEKSKLISAGKIKKNQLLNTLANDEKPFELPLGWEWAKLGSIGNTQTGATPSKSNLESFGSDIPFVKPGDIYKNYVEYENEGLSFLGAAQSGRVAPSGSVLMVCIGTIGKCNLIERDCSFNQQINSITPYIFDSRYLLTVCRSSYFHTEAWSRSSSTTIAILNKGNWEEIGIPIPPLEEQHRIVAKVDELMALCDQLEAQNSDAANAHEQLVSNLLGTLTQSQCAADFNTNWQRIAAHFDTLFTTEASIDSLKQTLLQLAVMGKLVEQIANDEPISELFKRIQAEKAKLIAEGKIKKDKLFAPSVERENPYSVPRSWKWITLDEISQVGTGATPLRTTFEYFNPPSISWVTSGETSHSFIFKTEQYVSPLALRETNLTVYPIGTLIVAMYGQGKTRGQITELMIEACTNQACAAIQLYCDNEYHRKYVKLFFEKIYDEIRELAAGGAQPNLNLSKIKETLLPLPPLSEQHRIVAKIDELMNMCNQLRSSITGANQQQQKLADVLVDHAVMG